MIWGRGRMKPMRFMGRILKRTRPIRKCKIMLDTNTSTKVKVKEKKNTQSIKGTVTTKDMGGTANMVREIITLICFRILRTGS